MTWKELRDEISRMTEEDQQKQVAIWGECFSSRDNCRLHKVDENTYYNPQWGECFFIDDLTEEELSNPDTTLVCKRGQYYLL